MPRLARSLSIGLVLSAFGVAAVHAQPSRTFVSAVGDDINSCSRTSPCKTLAGAFSKTAAGGEISVLDAGSYGSLTITKSITINGDGTLASVLHSGLSGLIINITNPADIPKKVVLRNISFNGAANNATGQPNGLNPIRFLAGNQLQVENVSISGCTQRGIDVALGANAQGTVYVQDSVIANCPTGIRATASSGFAEVILHRVRIEGAANGVELATNGRLIARESAFLGNGLNQNGVLLSAANALATLDRCMVAFNNASGVNAAVAGAIARVSSSSFLNNSIGISTAAGGTTLSDGRNVFAGNGADGIFTGGLLVD
jgi:hypothetical protein